MAQEAPYVLIYSIGRTEKQEALFKWIDVIAPYDVYLYKLKSRLDIHVNDLADLKNFKISAVRDDVCAQHLEKLGIKLDLANNDSANIKKIVRERIEPRGQIYAK